ncbi:cytochrome oxidase putative small subunit CydP [Thiobacillus sedimenti]|uniref:Uncharacterized protein n=1 Tax=Thiobacillus sedimenti TaxID=3110231 RepID=A0ABZ1CMT7_9PROT|nr:cytochrome oxidase putative small subunit CydP [Thiobacillus sp. SCUT-2]WRS40659.1 hypothetical protein VA613_07205 [Thiobacillus sp. SCUT-2]
MKKPLPAFLRHPLAREIGLALLVKLILIAAIFYAFFGGPAVPTDADSVAARLVGPEVAAPSSSTSGSDHAH